MAGLITRFAPSPTGRLHLGHALAALTAFDLARNSGGHMCLRIEDIDRARCRADFEQSIYDDLQWLGIGWQGPVLHQSLRRSAYDAALARLVSLGVTYRCTCKRSDIQAALSAPQEGVPVWGPDGLVYPGICRDKGRTESDAAVRLDLRRALQLTGPVSFQETGPLETGVHRPEADSLIEGIGDIVLARRDIGVSYHLAVSVDDAAQGVTLVSRGVDLFAATPVHVVLQRLLDLPTPIYHHHALVRDADGKRLAKRNGAQALSTLRAEGRTPSDLRAMLGLHPSG